MGYLLNYWVVGNSGLFLNVKKPCIKRRGSSIVFARSITFTLALLSAISVANAQITQTIENSNADLQQHYFEELDKWMLRAYEGDRDAQFKVGALFANDQFDQPNTEQAVYWYKQAARQGHILAQYNLGHHLLTGNGAEKNESEAIQWWKEAAKEDHALAQFNVGRAYFLGIGVEEDHNQSRYWFSRAAQNKEPKSIDVLKQLGWQIDLSITSQMANTAADDEVDVYTSTTSSNSALTNRKNQRQSSASEPLEPASNQPVALYTDPSIRSVLITIIDDRANLKIVESSDDWIIVSHPKGFPVWVHGDYLQVASNSAIVNGSNVNARSVPLMSTGTVVGKLQGGEQLSIIDTQDGWYRLTSPSSFKAWVKSDDYNRTFSANTITGVIPSSDSNNAAENPNSNDNELQTQTVERVATIEPETIDPKTIDSVTVNESMTVANDNAWLFSQAKDSFTLQLASFDDEQKVNTFLSQNSFSNDVELHRFTATSKDITWTYFLYGNYVSRADAEATKTRIKQDDAWIRNLGSLQENRCLAWKTKLPTPPELNEYCN